MYSLESNLFSYDITMCLRSFSNRAASMSALMVLCTRGGASAGWVDPDTPEEMRTATSLIDNTEYTLVRTN